jgi:hypothetical protein
MAGIVEPEVKSIVRQRFGKHVPASNNRGIVGKDIFYSVRLVMIPRWGSKPRLTD